jgi:Restriction endonuclease
MKKSPLDEVFKELYGFYPDKAGQAFEMMVAAAFKLLWGLDISYNDFVQGQYSGTTYQLDGTIQNGDSKSMIEAKDYSLDGRKVGRGDVQKMQGALSDLIHSQGIFASSTDYTGPAIKYADSSTSNPLQKPIVLFNIRPSVIEDERGRLKKVIVTVNICRPEFQKGVFDVRLEEEYKDQFKNDGVLGKVIQCKLEEFYDRDRKIKLTMEQLSGDISKNALQKDVNEIYATWIFNETFIQAENRLYKIRGLTYKIPISTGSTEFVIQTEGSAKLFIRSMDGKIDKLIYDEELKKVHFENGRVTLKR